MSDTIAYQTGAQSFKLSAPAALPDGKLLPFEMETPWWPWPSLWLRPDELLGEWLPSPPAELSGE
jgi:hypothetical protein